MAVGAFPGSFNPPTVAHLAIAEAAWRQCDLVRVDLIVSRRPLGKAEVEVPRLEDRIAVLERVAASRPWLGVRVTEERLLADVAEGYDTLVLGADKWRQITEPDWYGSEAARDDALRRLPPVVVAPRGPHPAPGYGAVLDLTDSHLSVSSTAARSGRVEWMVPEAVDFDERTGAWTDPERYRKWLADGGPQ